MGTSTEAYLVYGIQLEGDSISSQGGYDAPEGTPKRLAYTGNEFNGIRILRYGSGTYPEYIVFLAQPMFLANRGGPELINPQEIKVDPESDKKIVAYCEEHQLKTQGMLGWLLCSYYKLETQGMLGWLSYKGGG